MSSPTEFLQKASEVLIEEMFLVSSSGVVVDLKTFFKEISIFESIYSPFMSGNILIADNLNLIKNLFINGGEFLTIKIRTPGLSRESYIYKTFRVFSISNRNIVDQSSQIYILNFISAEGFESELNPLYRSFSGKASDIVANIFENNFVKSRYIRIKDEVLSDDTKSELLILDETDNEIKFISPGWSALKCLQWISSKSIPKSGKACNYLFFEGNKRFYFGPLEYIFKLGIDASIGLYRFFPSGAIAAEDAESKLFQISSVRMKDISDSLNSSVNGRLASRMVNINFFEKDYSYKDYYHIDSYFDYVHTGGTKDESVIPIFSIPAIANPTNYIKINTVHPNLFDNAIDNVSEKNSEIFGNRISNLLDLETHIIEIIIPGRSDVEVGSLVYLDFPDTSPVDGTDILSDNSDGMLSGRYIITKINHKINSMARHDMICEVARDSYTDISIGNRPI